MISTIAVHQPPPTSSHPANSPASCLLPASSSSSLSTRRVLENLQFLDLTDCLSLEDSGVKMIVETCPQLNYLYMRRCANITGKYFFGLCMWAYREVLFAYERDDHDKEPRQQCEQPCTAVLEQYSSCALPDCFSKTCDPSLWLIAWRPPRSTKICAFLGRLWWNRAKEEWMEEEKELEPLTPPPSLTLCSFFLHLSMRVPNKQRFSGGKGKGGGGALPFA